MDDVVRLSQGLAWLRVWGKEFEFLVRPGEVVMQKVRWERFASVEGPAKEFSRAVKVVQDVEIGFGSGEIKRFTLPTDTLFALRPGQRVSLVCVRDDRESEPQYVALFNHVTLAWVELPKEGGPPLSLPQRFGLFGSLAFALRRGWLSLINSGQDSWPGSPWPSPIRHHAQRVVVWCAQEGGSDGAITRAVQHRSYPANS